MPSLAFCLGLLRPVKPNWNQVFQCEFSSFCIHILLECFSRCSCYRMMSSIEILMGTVLSSKQTITLILGNHQNTIWNPSVLKQRFLKLQLAFPAFVFLAIQMVSCLLCPVMYGFIWPGQWDHGKWGDPTAPHQRVGAWLGCLLHALIRKHTQDPLSGRVVVAYSHGLGVWRGGEGRTVSILIWYCSPDIYLCLPREQEWDGELC